MKRTFLTMLSLVTIGVGGVGAATASAQEPPPASGGGGGGVEYKSKTVYDFDDDIVEGDLVRPDGEFVDTRKAAKHSSLIKIRPDFIPEMLKAAEDI